MLEEVQVPPVLFRRVAHGTSRIRAALFGAGEPGTARKIERDIEHAKYFVEFDRDHLPGRRQSQRCTDHLEQNQIAHQPNPLVDGSGNLPGLRQRLPEVRGLPT
ncbi:MAG: hypothetical protein ACYDEH_07905 [Acidimicrobiales bacterium]